MEHHHHIFDDQTKILHMKNLKCCQSCPRVLKKKLPNIPGVDSVRIDKENGLIFVTGPIDAMTLLNTVAELGKTVNLLPNVQIRKKTTVHIEELPTSHESHQSHSEGYSSSRSSTFQHHRRSKGKSTHEGPPPQHKHEREEFDFYQNPSNQGNGRFKPGNRQRGGTHHQGPPHDHVHHHHKQEEAQEEEHKCEEYVPFAIDPRACRDFYCLTHPSMREVGNRVDGSDDGSSLMRTSPFFGNFGPGGSYYGAPYFGNPSLMYGGRPPHQYGYNQHPRMLQRPFGFQ